LFLAVKILQFRRERCGLKARLAYYVYACCNELLVVDTMTKMVPCADPSSCSAFAFSTMRFLLFIIHYSFLLRRTTSGSRGKNCNKSVIVMNRSVYRGLLLNIHSRSSNTLAWISRLVLNPKSQSLNQDVATRKCTFSAIGAKREDLNCSSSVIRLDPERFDAEMPLSCPDLL
jgi:hypothetical protein